MTAPAASPGVEHWQELIPARPGVKIEDFQPFAGYAVLSERADALPQFEVMSFADGSRKHVPLPEAAYDAGLDHNAEFASASFRFNYQSPVTPPSVYDYTFATGEQTLVKRNEILGGYDPAKYTVERVRVAASDGVQVPLDIVRRKDVALDGKAPCWLYGYGSYGISEDATFSANHVRCSTGA